MSTLRTRYGRAALGLALLLPIGLPSTALASEPLPSLKPAVTGPIASVPLADLLIQTDMQPSARVLRELGHGQKAGDAPMSPMRPMAGALDGLSIHQEIIVLEGDNQTVHSFGGGDYGLRLDDEVQNLPTITERIIDTYGDEFDFVAIWTAFDDSGAQGLAYYVGVRNDVRGIGQQLYDNSQFWGSHSGGRLQGVLNMKSIGTYGDITDAANFVYPVMGQELTHRWLAFLEFERDDGTISGEMLGRDEAHWSSLLQAEASVQDGNRWVDNNNGKFTLAESMARFSPLDLYGMGLYSPDEVPSWFLIDNARYQGQSYSGLAQFPVGITIRGDRTDINIAQVVSANGPRIPTLANSQKEFRIAYVLVTAPGQTVDDVQDTLSDIQTFRGQFDTLFGQWTENRAALCTRTTGSCDRPQLRLTQVALTEQHGDGDGMAEPGEVVSATITVQNNGGGTAVNPRVHLVVPEGLDISVGEPVMEFGDLAVDASVTLPDVWQFTLGEDAPCATDVRFTVEMATDGLLTLGELVLPVGYLDLFVDDFETESGWLVNASGSDDAQSGTWERSTPEAVDAGGTGLDFRTQPGNGASGSAQAFVTGAEAGEGLGSNDIDDGITTLLSPSIDLTSATDPTLTWYTWRTGLDFNTGGNFVGQDDNDPLVTEVSGDDGSTWTTIDEDRSNDQTWKLKSARLLDVFETLPNTLQIRFTAIDADPQSLSEAGIDEVRVFGLQSTCFGLPNIADVGHGSDASSDSDTSSEGDTNSGPDVGTSQPPQSLAGRQRSGCSGGDLPITPPLLLFALVALLRRRLHLQR